MVALRGVVDYGVGLEKEGGGEEVYGGELSWATRE